MKKRIIKEMSVYFENEAKLMKYFMLVEYFKYDKNSMAEIVLHNYLNNFKNRCILIVADFAEEIVANYVYEDGMAEGFNSKTFSMNFDNVLLEVEETNISISRIDHTNSQIVVVSSYNINELKSDIEDSELDFEEGLIRVIGDIVLEIANENCNDYLNSYTVVDASNKTDDSANDLDESDTDDLLNLPDLDLDDLSNLPDLDLDDCSNNCDTLQKEEVISIKNINVSLPTDLIEKIEVISRFNEVPTASMLYKAFDEFIKENDDLLEIINFVIDVKDIKKVKEFENAKDNSLYTYSICPGLCLEKPTIISNIGLNISNGYIIVSNESKDKSLEENNIIEKINPKEFLDEYGNVSEEKIIDRIVDLVNYYND